MDSTIRLKNEDKLLLCCARAKIDDINQKKIISLVKLNLDWDYLLKIAAKHKLQQLVYYQLNQISLNEIPSEVLQCLHKFLMKNASKNLFFMKELINIVRLLSEQGVKSLPYKGPILAKQVYGNISMRQFGDLDLLIKREYLPLIKKILISQDYQPEFDLNSLQEKNYLDSQRELKFTNDKTGISLELHWKFSGIFLNLPSNAEKILLSNLSSIDIGGVSIPDVSPENLILILSIHNASHHWNRLLWLVDIATLIDNHNIDWRYVLKTAEKLSIKKILFVNLYLCHFLLDLKLENDILDVINTNSVLNTSNIFIKNIFSQESEWSLINNVKISFKIREKKIDGMKDCLTGIFNPSFYELNNLTLPPSLFFLYYIYRPLNLLKRYKLFNFNDL